MTQPITIKELESSAGVPRRTIHFYIKEGILPPPIGSRRNARYSQEHVHRLQLLRALKESTHLRLEGIREILDRLSPEEMGEWARGIEAAERDPAELPMWDFERTVKTAQLDADAEMLLMGSATGDSKMPDEDFTSSLCKGRFTGSAMDQVPRTGVSDSPSQAPPEPEEPQEPESAADEAWRRVRLSDDVEIHYRSNTPAHRRSIINRLIEIAKRLLGK